MKNSKKWTAFPKEYLTQIQQAFSSTFKKHLDTSKLKIEGRIYSQEILLRVGLLRKGKLAGANFEVSMEYSPIKKDAIERIHDSIDAIASLMNDYFEADGEVDLPRTWQEFEFNNKPLYLQFSTVNPDLEEQADELLGKSFENMVQEDKEIEDALDLAEEKIEASEEEKAKGPSMFGGAKKKRKPGVH